MRKPTALLSFALSLAVGVPGVAVGQTASSGWQAEMDLVTAGAAASIVLHHVCAGSTSSQNVAAWVVRRLNNEVARLSTQASEEEVRAYVFDAADLKVKAMSQSTQGQGCSQLRRLRDIVSATGFPLP